MNNNYVELPPAYTEVTEKSNYYPATNRTAAYAVSPPQPIESVKYTAPNEPIPNTFDIEINIIAKLSDKPLQCTCPNCRSLIITSVERTPGLLVWLISLVLFIFGYWLGCCLIPFCIRDVQNTQHICPNCNAFLGEYRLL